MTLRFRFLQRVRTLGEMLCIGSPLMREKMHPNFTRGADNRRGRDDTAGRTAAQVAAAGKTASPVTVPQPETDQTVRATDPARADVKALEGGHRELEIPANASQRRPIYCCLMKIQIKHWWTGAVLF